MGRGRSCGLGRAFFSIYLSIWVGGRSAISAISRACVHLLEAETAEEEEELLIGGSLTVPSYHP